MIEEVIKNGFKYDLCLQCKENDECKHDDYSLLTVVDEKLNHVRHKRMGSPLHRYHMLALILYTGGDCNYDLCKSQRNGNYDKWKWFDFCLFWGITKLSQREEGKYKLYSGLNKVKLNKKEIKEGYFVTYVSTSWNKNIAQDFMNGEGMIIEIDENFKNGYDIYCCDVSWISKFPDECEVLFCRSAQRGFYGSFSLLTSDEKNGIQTVSMQY